MLVLLALLGCSIQVNACFDAAPNSFSRGILARDVDSVNDRANELRVKNDSLVVHYPNINEASVGMDQAQWVLCIMFEHVGSTFFGG